MIDHRDTPQEIVIIDRGGERFNIDGWGARPGLEGIDATTAAIDTLMDTIAAKGRGVIFVPGNGYFVRGGRTMRSGVSIESLGGGEGSTQANSALILEPGATTPWMFNIPVGTKRFGFRNICLDGNRANQEGGVAGDTVTVLRGDSGGSAGAIAGYGFNIMHAHNLTIREVQVGYDFHTPGQCDWSNVRVNGATICGRWKYEHVNQTGSYYLNFTRYGLYLDEAIHSQMHDLYFGHGAGTGVGIAGTVTGSSLSEASITICHFIDLKRGVDLKGAKYLRTGGNRFDTITEEAMLLEDPIFVQIIGGTCKNVALDGYDGRDGVTPENPRAAIRLFGANARQNLVEGVGFHSLVDHTSADPAVAGTGMQYGVDAWDIPDDTAALKLAYTHHRNLPRAVKHRLRPSHIDWANSDDPDAIRVRNRLRMERDLEFAEGARTLEQRIASWTGIPMDALDFISAGGGSGRRVGVNTNPYTITGSTTRRTLDPATSNLQEGLEVLATFIEDMGRNR